MSRAEKYIIDSTKNYSNEKRITVGKISHWEKQPWLTPDDARKAVEIAREEMLNEICEWIGEQKDLLEDSFSDPNDFADILKQAMEE